MSSEFLIPLLTIIGIDIVLGGDNAIVVALACRNLPAHIRNKAMIAGILLAIIARAILTLIAVQLLSIPYAMPIGGAILLWIAFRLLTGNDDEQNISGESRVIDAIKTIVIADIVMGFDNVLAVAGAANGNGLLVLLGLLISVPIIIWGSKLILYLMNKYAFIIYIGAGILVYTSGKMILYEKIIVNYIHHFGINDKFFIMILITIILFLGWIVNHMKSIQVIHFRTKK